RNRNFSSNSKKYLEFIEIFEKEELVELLRHNRHFTDFLQSPEFQAYLEKTAKVKHQLAEFAAQKAESELLELESNTRPKHSKHKKQRKKKSKQKQDGRIPAEPARVDMEKAPAVEMSQMPEAPLAVATGNTPAENTASQAAEQRHETPSYFLRLTRMLRAYFNWSVLTDKFLFYGAKQEAPVPATEETPPLATEDLPSPVIAETPSLVTEDLSSVEQDKDGQPSPFNWAALTHTFRTDSQFGVVTKRLNRWNRPMQREAIRQFVDYTTLKQPVRRYQNYHDDKIARQWLEHQAFHFLPLFADPELRKQYFVLKEDPNNPRDVYVGSAAIRTLKGEIIHGFVELVTGDQPRKGRGRDWIHAKFTSQDDKRNIAQDGIVRECLAEEHMTFSPPARRYFRVERDAHDTIILDFGHQEEKGGGQLFLFSMN
ncbi:MAG: hypothetical protein OXT67_14120, partial [Zetaproteobacteria bacterium]|nr:hypothetical protein [Zetaproteobacteria bacterium]